MSSSNAPFQPLWAAWGVWHATPFGFVELCSKMQSTLGPRTTLLVCADLRSGYRQYQIGEQPTRKELANFRHFQLLAASDEVDMEVNLVRKRGGAHAEHRRGVSLKTTPRLDDLTAVSKAAHNSVVAK